MAKAYWISAYRSVRDPESLAAYARLAGPALQAAGGRFLARGVPARVYESGLEQRTVLIEFESVAQAIVALSRLALDEEYDVADAEINPLLVRREGEGVVALDALVRLA